MNKQSILKILIVIWIITFVGACGFLIHSIYNGINGGIIFCIVYLIFNALAITWISKKISKTSTSQKWKFECPNFHSVRKKVRYFTQMVFTQTQLLRRTLLRRKNRNAEFRAYWDVLPLMLTKPMSNAVFGLNRKVCVLLWSRKIFEILLWTNKTKRFYYELNRKWSAFLAPVQFIT